MNENRNTPYFKVAKEALMKWNGLSQQEADNIISNSSREESQLLGYK